MILKTLFFSLACMASFLTASPARAQVQAVGVHLASHHTAPAACRADNGGRNCNDANPGAYVRWQGGWVAGGYHNSVNKPTWYAGRSWTLAARGRASLDVAALAATGYPAAAVVPLVTPTAALRLNDRASIRLAYLPRLGKWNETHVFHLTFEVRR